MRFAARKKGCGYNGGHTKHNEYGCRDVNDDEPASGSPGSVLCVKKIHGFSVADIKLTTSAMPMCRNQLKETAGTSRFSSASISKKLAASKLNMPAMTEFGKLSTALL